MIMGNNDSVTLTVFCKFCGAGCSITRASMWDAKNGINEWLRDHKNCGKTETVEDKNTEKEIREG